VGQGLIIVEDSCSHTVTPHLVGLRWASDRHVTETSTCQHTTATTDRHSPLRWDSNPQSQQAAADPRLRPHSHWNRLLKIYITKYIFLGSSHIRRSYNYLIDRSCAAARFLRLWVRIPPVIRMSFSSVECCVLAGKGLCVGRSLVQRSPTECGGSECDLETSTIRRPGSLGLSSHEKRYINKV
jgi:hypothetical protein